MLLREELGTAPGGAVRALHQRLLDRRTRREPGPAPETGSPTGSRSRSPRPGSAGTRSCAGCARRPSSPPRGETGLVLVTGEGGIGKTRLVAELAHRMPAFQVLYGRCDEEELFPFGPWIDMLRPHLARMPQPDLAELVAGAPELARLLPEIRERVPDLAGLPPVGEPETRRRQMFGAVVAVVRRLAAHGPVLMIVDDLHWADRSSLLLARHVAKEPRLGAVLMVGTFRDSELQPGHPLPELLAELERGRELPRVRLDGMDEREVAQLIGGDAAPGTVSAIHAETGGNPFFVKQLARHLEELDGAPVAGAGVPQGVRDVIAARVGRLSEHAGRVLGVAALIGRDFDLELLERVAGLPEDELLDVLDAAVRGALLAEVAEHARPLLVRPRPAAHDARGRALGDPAGAAAPADRRGDRAAPRRSARPVARRAGAALRRRRAAGGRPRRRLRRARRRAGHLPARLRRGGPAAGRRGRLRRRDEHADRAELARLENALAAAQADAGPVGGGARELRPRRGAARTAGAADGLRPRRARARRRHLGAVRRPGRRERRAAGGGAAAAARGGLGDARAGARPASRSTAASSRRSPRPRCGRSRTRRSRWRAGWARPSRWRRR